MTGEDVFRALIAVEVPEVIRTLNAVDKGQVVLASMQAKFRALPKRVQAVLNALAEELAK